MAYDDRSLHPFRAIQDIVLGVNTSYKRGEILQATEDEGKILISVGLVEPADEPKRLEEPGRHRRRDLRADE